MDSMEQFISYLNSCDIFKDYAFYSSILMFKMMFMTLLTIRQRFRKGVFSSPEDGIHRKITIRYDDPDVKRMRRAHRNDVENIPIFLIAAFLFIFTKPDRTQAKQLFQAFTASRLFHTLVYAIYVIPQPARVVSFFIGYIITAFMLLKVIICFY